MFLFFFFLFYEQQSAQKYISVVGAYPMPQPTHPNLQSTQPFPDDLLEKFGSMYTNRPNSNTKLLTNSTNNSNNNNNNNYNNPPTSTKRKSPPVENTLLNVNDVIVSI